MIAGLGGILLSPSPQDTRTDKQQHWRLEVACVERGRRVRSAAETRPVLVAAAGRERRHAASLRGHGRADRVAALARGVESGTGWRNPGEASRGGGEVSEKTYGKRVKVPAYFHPDGAHWAARWLAPGVQNCACERAGGEYIAVAQDTKMEILVECGYRF